MKAKLEQAEYELSEAWRRNSQLENYIGKQETEIRGLVARVEEHEEFLRGEGYDDFVEQIVTKYNSEDA